MTSPALQDWVSTSLVCPVDREPLAGGHDALICPKGHRYPVVDGIPILLVERADPTHPYCADTLQSIRDPKPGGMFPGSSQNEAVDPFVQDEIVRTNGNLYRHLRGRLPRYPIPEFRFGPGHGRLLLDIGSNWGRWTFSAAKAGFRAVGLDPWIEAARAGQRVARQLHLDVAFVVGDARCLPFGPRSFDVTFSYSVLQHFDKSSARQALREMARVTRTAGRVITQMPNLFGLRQAYNRVRQLAAGDENIFRVRYWRPSELRNALEELVGAAHLEVDGFFSLNPQAADTDLLSPPFAWLVRASELLRRAAQRLPLLRLVADSLYVEGTKREESTS